MKINNDDPGNDIWADIRISTTIKKAVTGNGRAEKSQVQSMVGRLMPSDAPSERPDVADAIATALCHLFGSGVADALREHGVDGRLR